MVAGLAAGLAGAPRAKDRYALGDSVMLGAKDVMKRLGRVVDAEETGRPTAVRPSSFPPENVVYLGTNGTFPSCHHAMVKAAGLPPRVLVTIHAPRSWRRATTR